VVGLYWECEIEAQCSEIVKNDVGSFSESVMNNVGSFSGGGRGVTNLYAVALR
jgi:hypothetical protein